MQASFGTDLDAAFGLPLDQTLSPQPITSLNQAPVQPTLVQSSLVQPKPIEQQPQQKSFDNKLFNQQFDMYQNAMKQQQMIQNAVQKTKQYQQPFDDSNTYMNKAIAKKRDMLKLIVLAMMIIVAISIHSCVEFWMKDIVAAYELSYRQELGLRVMYPILIILIVWHFKTILVK